jgi:hypothetical protein
MKVRRDDDQGAKAVLNYPALDRRRIFDRVVRSRIHSNAAFEQLTMGRVQPGNLIAVVDPGDEEAITVTSFKKIDCGNDAFRISAERYDPVDINCSQLIRAVNGKNEGEKAPKERHGERPTAESDGTG